MIDKIEANELLDVYGGLLTPRQQEILEYYYEEDFSISEIAEELEISRSGVQDAIHKATKQLEKYESVVQYVRKKKEVYAAFKDNTDALDAVKKIF